MNGWVNFPPFRHVEVWDMGRKLMQIEFRVVEGGHQLPTEPSDVDPLRYGRPYTLEVIIRGTNGVHTFADSICDGELKPSGANVWNDRSEIGRYVYDWSKSGRGDEIVITNGSCQISIHIDRDDEGRLTADVVDHRVFVTRPQWGRFWRRPKALAA